MDTVKFDWKISLRHPFRIHYSTHLSGVSEGVTDIHSSIHIGLLIKGDTTGSHNGEILTVNEGGIYLTAPWEPHRTLSSEKGNNLLLITAETGILNQLLPGCGEKLDMLCRIAPRRRQEILDQAEIPELFEIGVDLEAYGILEELVDKCSYYLTHEDERRQIALNGYRKVKEYHGYVNRMVEMIRAIN